MLRFNFINSYFHAQSHTHTSLGWGTDCHHGVHFSAPAMEVPYRGGVNAQVKRGGKRKNHESTHLRQLQLQRCVCVCVFFYWHNCVSMIKPPHHQLTALKVQAACTERNPKPHKICPPRVNHGATELQCRPALAHNAPRYMTMIGQLTSDGQSASSCRHRFCVCNLDVQVLDGPGCWHTFYTIFATVVPPVSRAITNTHTQSDTPDSISGRLCYDLVTAMQMWQS